jgi:hypothetical protein
MFSRIQTEVVYNKKVNCIATHARHNAAPPYATRAMEVQVGANFISLTHTPQGVPSSP